MSAGGECLPGGCLSARGHLPRGCLPEGCLPGGVSACCGKHVCPEGLSAQGVCLPGVCLPEGVLPGGVLPPCGQTDTCENITFPQLLLGTVIKEILVDAQAWFKSISIFRLTLTVKVIKRKWHDVTVTNKNVEEFQKSTRKQFKSCLW